jgi:hypothetical protein
MKPVPIKSSVMPATARIGGSDVANLPNDFSKSRKESNHGGFGSGRGQGGKDTTSDMRALDVRRLQREGLLTPGRSFNWQWSINGEKVADINIRTEVGRVILNYRSRSNGGEWQPMEHPVTLERKPCNRGRRRAWLRCPARGCGQRVALLFGGSIFACRQCHKLVCQCQRETDDDLSMWRANHIRRRLGREAGIANPKGDKPKGMRWRTFELLKVQHDALTSASLAGMAERLRLMIRRPVA